MLCVCGVFGVIQLVCREKVSISFPHFRLLWNFFPVFFILRENGEKLNEMKTFFLYSSAACPLGTFGVFSSIKFSFSFMSLGFVFDLLILFVFVCVCVSFVLACFYWLFLCLFVNIVRITSVSLFLCFLCTFLAFWPIIQ